MFCRRRAVKNLKAALIGGVGCTGRPVTLALLGTGKPVPPPPVGIGRPLHLRLMLQFDLYHMHFLVEVDF